MNYTKKQHKKSRHAFYMSTLSLQLHNNGTLPVFSYERGEIMYSKICQTMFIVYETEGVEGSSPSKCNE